jgi:hypothetical protein
VVVNLAKPPELPDIQSLLEQYPNAPDWLWKGLAVWAVSKGIEWTWLHREEIASKLRRTPKDIIVHLQPMTLRAESPPVHISAVSQRLSSYAVRVGEESTRRSSYRIEAPTPSLARRLEELAAWYLHVS